MTHPVPFDTLVAYWLGETDEPTTHAIDEHLLACDRAPAHAFHVRLVAVEGAAERVIGRYTLNHSPT
jgi:anti-sigma factor RsiW